jgi:hypothetical protein
MSRAKYTLPNLPYPSFFINLKFYLLIPSFPISLNFGGDLVCDLRKEGKVLSDLQVASPSLEFNVEEVYFRALLAFPPDPRGLK